MSDSGDRFKSYYLNKIYMIWGEFDVRGEGVIGKINEFKVLGWIKWVVCIVVNWDVILRWEDGYGGWWESERLIIFNSILSLSWYFFKDVLY